MDDVPTRKDSSRKKVQELCSTHRVISKGKKSSLIECRAYRRLMVKEYVLHKLRLKLAVLSLLESDTE